MTKVEKNQNVKISKIAFKNLQFSKNQKLSKT